MLNGLKRHGDRMFTAAMDANLAALERLIATRPGRVLLDVGCNDGEHTMRFARAARADEVHGVEVVPEAAMKANEKGIVVESFDLCDRWPYEDRSIDVICSNQVIEHIHDTDHFVAETRRCLRPGGITVASTENLASWHNIGALVFGWQPFSLTNVTSTRAALGNPLGLHASEDPAGGPSWQHVRVFAFAGLRDLYEAHGLHVERVVGAGYYPLPNFVARFDPRHAAFITILASRWA